MCVGTDGKSVAKPVELAQQVGSYYIVTSGVTAKDTIVVEGLTTLREGVELAMTEVSAGDMGFTLSNITTPYQTETINNATSSNPNAPGNLNR
jgi:membrane fusion protein (multidrug efflux system)